MFELKRKQRKIFRAGELWYSLSKIFKYVQLDKWGLESVFQSLLEGNLLISLNWSLALVALEMLVNFLKL